MQLLKFAYSHTVTEAYTQLHKLVFQTGPGRVSMTLLTFCYVFNNRIAVRQHCQSSNVSKIILVTSLLSIQRRYHGFTPPLQ